MPWLYNSFADDEGFLGAVIIEMPEGSTVVDTAKELWRRGMNPGGELLCVPIPDDMVEEEAPETYRNRLLTKDDVKDLGGMRLGDLEAKYGPLPLGKWEP